MKIIANILLFYALLQISNSNLFGAHDTYAYNIIYARHCKEPGNNAGLRMSVAMRKFNRTHFGVSANVTLPEPFGKEYQADAEIRVWGDGGWKHNVVHYVINDACIATKTLFGPVWKKILEAGKMPNKCPIPPGYYEMQNFNVDLSNLPLIVRSGRIKIISMTKKKNVVQSCVEVECEIVKNI